MFTLREQSKRNTDKFFPGILFHVYFHHEAESHCLSTQRYCLKNIFFYQVRLYFLQESKNFVMIAWITRQLRQRQKRPVMEVFRILVSIFPFSFFSLRLKCQTVLLRDLCKRLCKGLCLFKIPNSGIFRYIFILTFIKLV